MANLYPHNNLNDQVHILYITYNRLYYTKKTLPPLLDSLKHNSYKLRIVDNASTDGTIKYLQSLNHPQIEKIIYNRKNYGLVKPTKTFWKESNAKFVGKIDNDILVPKNWIEKLIHTHHRFSNTGILGLCHFRKEDINNEIVKNKVLEQNGVYIRRQPWIGGNYIVKRKIVIEIPGYKQSRKMFTKRILYGFNQYQQNLSNLGYFNGYICDNKKNLLFWEHLDDPRHSDHYCDSEYYKIRNMSKQEIVSWYKRDAKQLLENYEK